MYFGTSLGRLGADVRSLLLPTFEKHVEALLRRRWQQVSRYYSKCTRSKLFGLYIAFVFFVFNSAVVVVVNS